MRKLLMLVLVLAVGSVANAGLSIVVPAEVSVGDVVTIQVVSDDTLQYDAYIQMQANGLAAWDATRIMPITVPAAGLVYYGEAMAGWDTYKIVNSDPSVSEIPREPGVGFEFDVLALAEGTVDFGLFDSGFGPLQNATLTIVPEPMTLALLGIGGLFLRRRK